MLCWWCCHPCGDISMGLPFKYNLLDDVYNTKGHFCSWNCMRAYVLKEPDYVRDNLIMLMISMRQKMGIKQHSIKKAPMKETLKVFGGILSIDEFRKGADKYWMHIPGENRLIQHIEPRKKTTMAAPSIERKQQHISDINNASRSNNTLKLKRPVKGGIASLESLMQITRKKK